MTDFYAPVDALPVADHAPATDGRVERFTAALAADGLIITDRTIVERALAAYDMVVRIDAADNALTRYAQRTGALARMIFPDFDDLEPCSPTRAGIRRMMRAALEAADGAA